LCSARPRLSHLFQPSALLQTEEIPDKFTAPIPPPVMIDIGTKAPAGRRVPFYFSITSRHGLNFIGTE
jgi:hypothetical protein